MTNPYPNSTDWPVEYNGCHIQGKFLGLDGNPIVGSVTFVAQISRLIAASSKVIIIPRPLQIILDQDGTLDLWVPASDDPDIIPNGFLYQVTENWIGGSQYQITAPTDGIEDLSTLVPTDNITPGTVGYYLTPEQFDILSAGSAADVLDGGSHA